MFGLFLSDPFVKVYLMQCVWLIFVRPLCEGVPDAVCLAYFCQTPLWRCTWCSVFGLFLSDPFVKVYLMQCVWLIFVRPLCEGVHDAVCFAYFCQTPLWRCTWCRTVRRSPRRRRPSSEARRTRSLTRPWSSPCRLPHFRYAIGRQCSCPVYSNCVFVSFPSFTFI